MINNGPLFCRLKMNAKYIRKVWLICKIAYVTTFWITAFLKRDFLLNNIGRFELNKTTNIIFMYQVFDKKVTLIIGRFKK